MSLKALAKNIQKYKKMSKSVTMICRSCHGVEIMLNKISDHTLHHANYNLNQSKGSENMRS